MANNGINFTTFKYFYIYKIVNLINKKCYVGFHATNKEFDKDKYFGSSETLNDAIKKYGINNFCMGVIEYVNFENWKEKETYWIKEMHSHTSEWGYNQTYGGNGTAGFKWTETSKMKASKARKGTRTGEENSFYGKHHTKETRKKISKAMKKRDPWNKGKTGVYSKETIQKFKNIDHKGEKNPMFGKKGILSPSFGLKRSLETKQKLSNAKLGENNPNAGLYEIYAPDGNYFIVKSATTFVKEHPEYNINRFFIYTASSINGKLYKNWRIKKLN